MVTSPKAAGKAGKNPGAKQCSCAGSKQSPSPSRGRPAHSPPPHPAGEHSLSLAAPNAGAEASAVIPVGLDPSKQMLRLM